MVGFFFWVGGLALEITSRADCLNESCSRSRLRRRPPLQAPEHPGKSKVGGDLWGALPLTLCRREALHAVTQTPSEELWLFRDPSKGE